MNRRQLAAIGLTGICSATSWAIALADTDIQSMATGLVGEVREATRDFRDVAVAMAAGYGSTGSCISGPEEGAMGIHYAKGELIDDGELDARRPELLIYEQKGRHLRLVGVEYLVIADAWHINNPGPPVLVGQHFHYVGTPNRYRLPAFYELHVWAWRNNPHGMFVDWNPAVSCEEYTGEVTGAPGHSGH